MIIGIPKEIKNNENRVSLTFLDITDILQCITPLKIVFTIIRFCDNVSLESEIESDRDDGI